MQNAPFKCGSLHITNEHMGGCGHDGSSFCSPVVKADKEADVALACTIRRSSVLFFWLIFHILPSGRSGRGRRLLPHLSTAAATWRLWTRLVWPPLVCCFFFLTERQESPLTRRIADRGLCRRSKHFTPPVVSGPVALLSQPHLHNDAVRSRGWGGRGPISEYNLWGRGVTQEFRVAKRQRKQIVCLFCLFVWSMIVIGRVLKAKPWAPSLSRYPAATSSSAPPLSLMVRDGLSVTLTATPAVIGALTAVEKNQTVNQRQSGQNSSPWEAKCCLWTNEIISIIW